MQPKRLSANFIFWIFLFCVTLLCIWKTQRAVPVMMDDDWYGTVLSSDTPLQTLNDIARAQIWHYRNWGGRSVAHTVLQLILLYLSEPAANALNVLLIVLLAWLINLLSGAKSLAFLTLTTGFLHGLNANWKMSMYWQTGACNYLYMTVIILAFLHLYLRMLDTDAKALPFSCVPAALLGLLAGWSNENMGPTAWLISLAVIFLLRRQKQPVRLWMWIGNICCLAGCLLMLLAPGNAVRGTVISTEEYGALWRLFLRMYGACKGAWDYLFPTLLLTAALLFVNLTLLGNRLNRKDLLLLAGGLLSWGAMALSPHYPDRAAFGTMSLLLGVIVSQAGSILKTANRRSCTAAMAGIGVFIWLRGMFFLGEFLSISWGWIR